ncbi:DDX28 helicase, partial [Upupa epops]|nr:DDX28 helicase [Upupa epops]
HAGGAMALGRPGVLRGLPLLLLPPRRSESSGAVEVVRVPWALRQRLQGHGQRRRRGQGEAAAAAPSGKLLLRSRRPELNQPLWHTVGRWEQPRLVSAGWKHRKARGDYFQLEPSQHKAPALQPSRTDAEPGPPFAEMGLPPALLPGLQQLSAQCPTAVQRLAIPALRRGRSALCAAETGKPLEQILAHAPLAAGARGPGGPCEERTQVVVVGATFPVGLSKTLSNFTDVDHFDTLSTQSLHRLPPHIQQKFVCIKGCDKLPELLQLLKKHSASTGAVLIFCNSASTVNWLGYILDDHRIKHLRLQGQMCATARANIFASFQKGDVNVLVCTDLASRGLDTSSVQLVVNYDFPDTLQDYLHRVGRVGRVGSKARGTVVSFVTHRWDVDLVQKIETAARKRRSLPGMNS